MRFLVLAAALAAIPLPAWAVTLKSESAACLSPDLLDQYGQAVMQGDADSFLYLLGNGCSISAGDLHATVLGTGRGRIGDIVRVRVYRDRRAVEVWTARESLDGYDPLRPSVSR